jgi:hypothetical protein
MSCHWLWPDQELDCGGGGLVLPARFLLRFSTSLTAASLCWWCLCLVVSDPLCVCVSCRCLSVSVRVRVRVRVRVGVRVLG